MATAKEITVPVRIEVEDLPSFLHKIADRLDAYGRISNLPNCNDCGNKVCGYLPSYGDVVRYNCPLWKPEKEPER